MRRVVLFIFLVITVVSAIAQNKVIESANYTPYCGTWQYVNKDTTFTVSLKEVTVRMILSSSKTVIRKRIVGGYRLTVKGQFDDNYLFIDKIPSTIFYKLSRAPGYEGAVPANNVYVWADGEKGKNDLDCCLFNQNTRRKREFTPGFIIKILSNGKMKWHWDEGKAFSSTSLAGEYLEKKDIIVPGHAVMTKIK